MKTLATAAIVAIASCYVVSASAQPPDVAKFLRDRGAVDAGLRQVARSPVPSAVPVTLFEKGNSVPSCGVLISAPGTANARYVELVGSEPKENFPQCVAMPSMTAFRLQGRRYLMIETLRRETREDVYRAEGFQS